MCMDVYYTAIPLRSQCEFVATDTLGGTGNSLTDPPESVSLRAWLLDGSWARCNDVIGTARKFQDMNSTVDERLSASLIDLTSEVGRLIKDLSNSLPHKT